MYRCVVRTMARTWQRIVIETPTFTTADEAYEHYRMHLKHYGFVFLGTEQTDDK